MVMLNSVVPRLGLHTDKANPLPLFFFSPQNPLMVQLFKKEREALDMATPKSKAATVPLGKSPAPGVAKKHKQTVSPVLPCVIPFIPIVLLLVRDLN